MEEKTVQGLAKEYLEYFTTGQEKDGRTYVTTDRERSVPMELLELLYSAHAGMMPDGWKNEFVRDALQLITEADDLDSPEIEPDIYNNRLVAWLSSDVRRGGYISDYALKVGLDTGVDFDIYALIRQGELMEKEEVYQSVLNSLKDATVKVKNNEKE